MSKIIPIAAITAILTNCSSSGTTGTAICVKWWEYRYNPERLKRDLKALRQFKAQVKVWETINRD